MSRNGYRGKDQYTHQKQRILLMVVGDSDPTQRLVISLSDRVYFLCSSLTLRVPVVDYIK